MIVLLTLFYHREMSEKINCIWKWLSTPFYLIVFKKCSYLQHAIQVKHSVKHCAKLHTKEAWRIRMQKLCNLLTNFALCFDRAHKEKRCPFKTDSITLFREGGPWTNEAMSCAAVSFPSGLHSARWGPQGLGPADTTLTANRTTFVHTIVLWSLFFFCHPKLDNQAFWFTACSTSSPLDCWQI